jgi:uncharacterized cysteine cluster protein YcgN (CxxCxxCC family)
VDKNGNQGFSRSLTVDRVAMEYFWKSTSMSEMTHAQWESLCDGCGRCCLQKLENRKTGKVYYTWVACYLLDTQTCGCTAYDQRTILVPGCQVLTAENIDKFRWLPKTCAYLRLAHGKGLDDWHPLVSGRRDSVHTAGISVRDKAISEIYIHPDDVEYYRIDKRF